jgi:chromate transporter
MVDMVAIAQSSPGAVAVNVASQLGFRLGKTRGMLAAVAGTVIPPLVLLSILSLCYDAFRTSPVVDAFLRSMQPAVAAVILSAALSMLRSLKNKKKPTPWILLACALALNAAGLNAIYILLLGAAAGALLSFWEVKRHAA